MAFDPQNWGSMSNDDRFMGFQGAGGMGNLGLRDQIAQQNFGGNQDSFNNWFNTTSYTNPFQRAQPGTGGAAVPGGIGAGAGTWKDGTPLPGANIQANAGLNSNDGTAGSYNVNVNTPPPLAASSTQQIGQQAGANMAGAATASSGLRGPAAPGYMQGGYATDPRIFGAGGFNPINSVGGATYNPPAANGGGANPPPGAGAPPPTTSAPPPTGGGGGRAGMTTQKAYSFNPNWGGSSSTFGTYNNPWGKTSWR